MLDWQKKEKKTASLTIKTATKSQSPPVLLVSNEIDPRRFILPTDEGLVSSVKAQTHSRVSWAMYKMSRGLIFSWAMGACLRLIGPVLHNHVGLLCCSVYSSYFPCSNTQVDTP